MQFYLQRNRKSNRVSFLIAINERLSFKFCKIIVSSWISHWNLLLNLYSDFNVSNIDCIFEAFFITFEFISLWIPKNVISMKVEHWNLKEYLHASHRAYSEIETVHSNSKDLTSSVLILISVVSICEFNPQVLDFSSPQKSHVFHSSTSTPFLRIFDYDWHIYDIYHISIMEYKIAFNCLSSWQRYHCPLDLCLLLVYTNIYNIFDGSKYLQMGIQFEKVFPNDFLSSTSTCFLCVFGYEWQHRIGI